MRDPIYYECHVTVEPVFDDRLELFKGLCKIHGFRVADLLMKKRPEDTAERSQYDTFCTARDMSYENLEIRMKCLLDLLKEYKFDIWRYKIEAALLDTKIVSGVEYPVHKVDCTRAHTGVSQC